MINNLMVIMIMMRLFELVQYCEVGSFSTMKIFRHDFNAVGFMLVFGCEECCRGDGGKG